MNKKLFIIFAAVIIVVVSVPAIAANFLKEPPRTSEVPDYAKWDSGGGFYVNTKAIELEEQANSQPVPVDTGGPSIDEQINWINENKSTNDVIDKAIVNWYLNSKLVKEPYRSFYDPLADDAFKYLTDLPNSEIDNMVKKIESNHPWRPILMQAVEAKMNHKFADQIDPSTAGILKWLANYKEFKGGR